MLICQFPFPAWQLANPASSRLEENFENPLHFDPDRFNPSKSRLYSTYIFASLHCFNLLFISALILHS